MTQQGALADPPDDRTALQDGLRLTAVALTDAEIPFALVGGYAAWARGAPEPSHDADFAVTEKDVDRAKEAIAAAGLDVEDPAENWLFKAFHHGQLVDVLFRMVGEPVTEELLARSDVLEVLAVRMPVLGATDVVSAKLRVLGEHACDFGPPAGHRAGVARADRLGPGARRRRTRTRTAARSSSSPTSWASRDVRPTPGTDVEPGRADATGPDE